MESTLVNLTREQLEIILIVIEQEKLRVIDGHRYKDQLSEIATMLHWHRAQIIKSGLTTRAGGLCYCTCPTFMPSGDSTLPTCRSCGKPQSR